MDICFRLKNITSILLDVIVVLLEVLQCTSMPAWLSNIPRDVVQVFAMLRLHQCFVGSQRGSTLNWRSIYSMIHVFVRMIRN